MEQLLALDTSGCWLACPGQHLRLIGLLHGSRSGHGTARSLTGASAEMLALSHAGVCMRVN